MTTIRAYTDIPQSKNLEKEIEKCLKKHNMLAVGRKDFTNIAKYFFELGLKAREQWKPSDEQLRVLELVTEYWRPDDVHTNTLLWNIIDNLKKL